MEIIILGFKVFLKKSPIFSRIIFKIWDTSGTSRESDYFSVKKYFKSHFFKYVYFKTKKKSFFSRKVFLNLEFSLEVQTQAMTTKFLRIETPKKLLKNKVLLLDLLLEKFMA